MLVGSYDDTLRIFKLNIKFNQFATIDLNWKLLQCVNVDGAFWRMWIVDGKLLASVMKQGVFIAKLPTKINTKINLNFVKLLDETNPRLIYGVACDTNMSTIMAASFDDCQILMYIQQ